MQEPKMRCMGSPKPKTYGCYRCEHFDERSNRSWLVEFKGGCYNFKPKEEGDAKEGVRRP